MNNRHKYFRNLRYKQKLETKYDNGNRNIYFITKEPDPRQARELQAFKYLYRQATEKYNGHDYYISWKRPEVPYTAMELVYQAGWKQVMKQQTSRRNRHIKIEEDDTTTSFKSYYKKVEDIWNYD